MIAALSLCLVVAVTDGDTIKVRCGQPGAFEQVTLRLGEIDAPENRQPFGQRSKQALAALCFAQQATIKPMTLDRYGRTVARVECRGKDASAEQVASGMAWAFTRYLKDQHIRDLETRARGDHAGLWSVPDPVAPWEWRRAEKAERQR